MILVPEAYRNHPELVKDYPEVSSAFGPSVCLACVPLSVAAVLPSCQVLFLECGWVC